MKTYLFVTVRRKDGKDYVNELKLSESHLINKILLLDGVKSVEVERVQCTKEYYSSLFGGE